MEKKWYRIIIIILVIALVTLIKHKNKPIPVEQFRVDTVYEQISKIDTLVQVIDKTIKTNEKSYQKDIIIIQHNNANDDLKFFSEYIERNKSRLDSINNNIATQIR